MAETVQRDGLQCVVFDLAGTVIDFGSLAPVEAFQRVFADASVPISVAEARTPMGVSKREHIQGIMALVAARWTAQHGAAPTEHDIDRLYAAYLPAQIAVLEDAGLPFAQLVPGALQAYQFAKANRYTVATTTGYVRVLSDIVGGHLRRQGFLPDCMVAADQVKQGRPAPHMLQQVMNKLFAAPGRTLNVDDTLPGIDAGLAAGCWTCFVYASGNELGMTLEQSLHADAAALDACRRAGARAHFSVRSVADLAPVMVLVDLLTCAGYSPHDWDAAALQPLLALLGDHCASVPDALTALLQRHDSAELLQRPGVAAAARALCANLREPLLYTPGPLTTTAAVKRAMLHDAGSRGADFAQLTRRVRDKLLAAAGADAQQFSTVLLQGSGTYAVEAVLVSGVDRASDRLLVLANGAYGVRLRHIAERHLAAARDRLDVLELPDGAPLDEQCVRERVLAFRPSVVAVVHVETSSGMLNDLDMVARVAADCGALLLVDTMSAFASTPIDLAALPQSVAALVTTSNKCVQGSPGLGIVVARRTFLRRAAAYCAQQSPLVLDLVAQHDMLDATGQFRFTPPTHTLLALDVALDELLLETVAGRIARYAANVDALLDGMQRLGFTSYLPRQHQSNVIATFFADPRCDFAAFCSALARAGFAIYPGKLTAADTFRIGCIGHLTTDHINALLLEIARCLSSSS